MSKVYYLDNLNYFNRNNIVACIGFFDGVHKGHQKLIIKTLQLSKQYKLKSALITFDPDPNEVILNKKLVHITDLDTRLNLISSYSIDYIYVIRFNKRIMNMSIDKFNNFLSFNLNVKKIVCGFDFTYGKFGKGNSDTLKEFYKKDFYKVNEVKLNGEKISSTNVRKEFKNNNIKLVNKYLGYVYFIEGVVEKGRGVGKKLSFPTANIKLNSSLILNSGVYYGYVVINNKKYKVMFNYGNDPTFNLKKNTLEVYIDKYNGNLYNKKLIVFVKEFVREEIKFNSKEELVDQLNKDLNKLRKSNV